MSEPLEENEEAELKLHLSFVYGAVICLVVGLGVRWLRPEQGDLATLLEMAAAILSGVPIILELFEGFSAKEPDECTEFYVNQFITLAVIACFVTGQYVTGAIVAIILMVGHVFENRSMLGVSEAINSLLNLSRGRARRMVDGREEEIDSELLREGDVIRVRPGDAIPADGTVLSGESTVNQANITGESLPVEVSKDSYIFAGTTNLSGMVEAVVVKAGSDTVLGRVKQIVEEARNSRAPIVRLTEQYAQYYLPLILLLAGFVLFFTHDLQRSISVVIVSIPCAFILAGPTAMVAALAAASRLGILVKSVHFFEAANAVDTVVFDKTGTLTTGRLQLARVATHHGLDADGLLGLAATVEAHSTHPVAKAIVQAAKRANLPIPDAADIVEEHGLGMTGRVDGCRLLVGRDSWLQGKGIALTADEAQPHHSAIHVARDQEHLGTIYLTDTVRDEARTVHRDLQGIGIGRLMMLTGDRQDVAQIIASEIGFEEYRAECLPEQKLQVVESLKSEGHQVMVVGDGVNDAPALAAGNLSIAMGVLGSDVAIQTADIALMANDLSRVAQFIQLSKKTVRIINQNILGGFLFSTAAIILSCLGYVSPTAACFVHEFGAFFVIFNSARLLKFDELSATIEPPPAALPTSLIPQPANL